MMKLKMVNFLMVIAVFSCCSSAMATKAKGENKAGTLTLGPSAGGYIFECDQHLKSGPGFGIGFGYNHNPNLGLEASFNYINTESTKKSIGDVNLNLFRLDGLYHFITDGDMTPYLAAGLGGMNLNPEHGHTDKELFINYGGGLKYFLNESTALRGDVRHIRTLDDGHNNLIYSLGITFIFDWLKKKPVEPPQARSIEPPPQPKEIAKPKPTPKAIAKPKPEPRPEPKSQPQPKPQPKDTDGDGVYDQLDKCPDTPAGMIVDRNGCLPDTDQDGVFDYLDKCPNTPKGAKVNRVGCWVIEGVLFDTAKWDIKPRAYKALDDIVTILRKNPSLHIEIQGHTDNRGTKQYNQGLSENRANSVMKYLVQKGIKQNRLTAKGFGLSKPIAPNDTEEGRAQNRRVELMPIL